MYNILRKKLLKIGISGRIILFFSSLLLFSLLVSGFFFQKIYSNMMLEQVRDSSFQTIRSIRSNIKTILKNVNNSSMVILSDPNIQELLRSIGGYHELELLNDVNKTISSMMGNYNEIYSIYLIDKKGRRYYSDTAARNFMYFNDEFFTKEWKRARDLKGASYYIKSGGKIFSQVTAKDFVSNIRVVNDIITQKPIGALLINVSIDSLVHSYRDVIGVNGTRVYLFDEKMEVITSSSDLTESVGRFLRRGNKEEINFRLDLDNGLIYTFAAIEPYKWSIVTVMPIVGGKHLTTLMLATLTAIMILATLVFIGSIFITKMITKPVNILVDSMAQMGQGDLKKVDFDTTIQEFNSLRDGYNSMTDEIKSLIDRTVFQEKLKRKAELNTLQAQIKPHFLYNTFDSISSLALMGKNDDVHKMVSSLGNFYRISLSKGREVISLSKELEALESYLDILKLRYNNFTVHFKLQDNIGEFQVLKLMLQPFIENSIYHGIKPKGEEGEIFIYAYIDCDYLTLELEDDGVGMSPKDIESLYSGENSFGVRGTIQRINLYYGRDDLVEIKSKRGAGTSVKIRVPCEDQLSEKNINS